MKRVPLKRKTPLKAKAGLKRQPMKPYRPRQKTGEERAHLARVAGMPCAICRAHPPSTVHHVRHHIERSGTMARDDKRVVPLCPRHHFAGTGVSVEDLHEAGIFNLFGVDLPALAKKLWSETCAAG